MAVKNWHPGEVRTAGGTLVPLGEVPACQRVAESGRRDSNPRPPGPKPGALPDCATPRLTTKNVEKKTSKELRQDNYVKKTT